MKKLICLSLVILTLFFMTGCNFTHNSSGALAGSAECTPKINEMLDALTDGRIADAKALLHPDVSEADAKAIEQVCVFLSGKEISATELRGIEINSSFGTGGKVRQENLVYELMLANESSVYINVTYIKNSNGSGFVSFQLVLGLL